MKTLFKDVTLHVQLKLITYARLTWFELKLQPQTQFLDYKL